nr:hypothetical protein [Gammaproteobacteria bacterium]
ALNARMRGEFAEAIRLCDTISNGNSTFVDDAMFLAGLIYGVDLGDHAGALRVHESLLERFPDSSYINRTLFALGSEYAKNADLPRAREYLERLRTRHADGDEAKDKLISRIWFAKAEDRLGLLSTKEAVEGQVEAPPFHFGVGSRLTVDQPVGTHTGHRMLWRLAAQANLPITHVTHWITRDTDWQWEHKQYLLGAAKAGYTPVVSFWYFGDQISPEFVRRNRAEYMKVIRTKLVPLIAELPDVLVLLEPEFNKSNMAAWTGWDTVAADAIMAIKDGAKNARVGLTFGDFGRSDVAKFEKVLSRSIDASDFLGYMEMRSAYDATYRLDPSSTLVESATMFARQLSQRFRKPIYLGYVALSTANGWEAKQAVWLNSLLEEVPVLAAHGVFGMSIFAMFDEPRHKGWFADAERSFGLFRADGVPKAGAQRWSEAVREFLATDSRAPELTTPIALTTDAGGVAGRASFSEWVRWRLQIKGRESGASRTLSGAGIQAVFSWHGQSDAVPFATEDCDITLTFVDRADNEVTVTEASRLRVDKRARTRPVLAIDVAPGKNTHVWNRAKAVARKFGYRDEGFTQLDFKGEPTGVNVELEAPLALQQLLREGARVIAADSKVVRRISGFLELQIRSSQDVEGLSVGLEDADGVRTGVALDAYGQAIDADWQALRIPLNDFPLSGRRYVAGDDGKPKPLNWNTVQRVVFIAKSQPAKVDIRGLRFDYLLAGASITALPRSAGAAPAVTLAASTADQARPGSRSSGRPAQLGQITDESVSAPEREVGGGEPSTVGTEESSEDSTDSQHVRGIYPQTR